MEDIRIVYGMPKLATSGRSEHNTDYQPARSIASVLTDAALKELKNQAAKECLLCSFEAWDGEEWD